LVTTTGKSAARSGPAGAGLTLAVLSAAIFNTASGWSATCTARTRTSARPGGVDMLAALTDMVAFNGGQPLSCYA
jgi:hypothetical protein